MNGYKITLSGDLGSGKSTITKYIIENYGFKTFSTGNYQREMAERMGMTTLELNRYAEEHPEIDADIDGKLTAIGKQNGNYIFDSRMAFHFVPASFKVYLTCNLDIAAERVLLDCRRGCVEAYKDIEDAKKYILRRRASEERRYLDKYKVRITDLANYNFTPDVSDMKVEEIGELIYTKMLDHYGQSPK